MLKDKLNQFAELLESDIIHELIKINCSCDANIKNAKVYIREDKKYTKVDIDGVIHKGYRFGTLDTINSYYWGGYYGNIKRTDKHPTELLTVEAVLNSRQKPLNVITIDFINRKVV